jgi:exosome complex component RRP40
MKRNSEVLAQLGKVYQYELGIGQNGRIWVKAPRPSDTIIVANAILASEFMDGRQIKRMVRRLSSQRS